MKFFRIISFIIFLQFLCFASLLAQTLPTVCYNQDSPQTIIDLDRKDWNSTAGPGSTIQHSQGYLHDFPLPANTFVCKKIDNIEIDIDIISVNNGSLPPPCIQGNPFTGDYYINFTMDCPVVDGASNGATCDPNTTLIGEPNANNIFSLTANPFNYGCPAQEFQFGGNLGVDIIPLMGEFTCPGWQTVVEDNLLTINYQICVTITLADDDINTPVDLGSDITSCPPFTEILDAGSGYSGYDWGGGINTQTLSATSNAIYEVTVTDNNGCTDTDDIEILLGNATVSIDNSSGSNVICAGSGINLVANTAPGSSFLWSPNGETTPNITASSADTYIVTVTDNNNCTAVDQIIITENNPSVTISSLAPNNEICGGSTTTITATTLTSDIDWSTGESGTSITVGTGSYMVTVTDIAGCTATDEITITSFTPPAVAINPSSPAACDGGTATVSATGGYTMYQWSGTSQTGNTVDLGPGSYTVTVTDNNNCTNTASVTIGSITSPDPGTSNFIDVCNDGTTYNIDALLGTHDFGTWDDVNGTGINLNINSTSVNFAGIPAGNYSYTYTVVGTAPCPDATSVINVDVAASFYAGINHIEQICNPTGTLDFNALISNPDLGGTWNELSGTGLNVNANPTAVDISSLTAGNYNFIYGFTASGACPAQTATLELQIQDGVNAGMPNSTSVCEGDNFDLLSLLSSDATSGGTFLDTDGSTILFGSTINTTSQAGQTYNYTYQVGSATDPCGEDSEIFTITIVNAVTAGADNMVAICESGLYNLEQDLVGADLGGSFADIDGGAVLVGNFIDTEAMSAGDYSFQYTVGDGVACPESMSMINITLFDNPTVSLTVDQANLCNDQCTDLNITLTGEPTYFFFIDLYDDTGSLINLIDPIVNSNNTSITICNNGDTGSYMNNTIGINANSTRWGLAVSSISDGNNCNVDFAGMLDTLYINTSGVTETNIDSTICSGDTITLNNMEFYLGNESFIDTLPGFVCDSIVNIQVNFYELDTTIIDTTICNGTSVMISGNTYDANQMIDTIDLSNVDGCDSLIFVNVSFYPTADSLIQLDLCSGDMIMVNGVIYDESNPDGEESLTSVAGCDSIITIDLEFGDMANILVDDRLCPDESIMINGTTYDITNQMGNETISNGSCDTMYTIALSFYAEADTAVVGPYCPDYFEIINGIEYNATNPTGTEVLENQSFTGCDSIININLQFYQEAINDIDEIFCEGESIMIGTEIFDINNATGTVVLDNMSSNGCDSTVNVNLIFNDVFMVNDAAEICDGDSLFLANAWQTTAGIYMDTLQSINACDSIISTDLSIIDCNVPISVSAVDNPCSGGNSGSISINLGNNITEFIVTWLGINSGTAGTETITTMGGYTITDLINDSYGIIVTDLNGQVLYDNVVNIMDANDPLIVSIDIISDVVCDGDLAELELQISGGVADYSIAWNDPSLGSGTSASDVSTGNYIVTVTDFFSCTSTASVEIENVVAITADIVSIPASCDNVANGTITVNNISGGTAPYTIFINGEVDDDGLLELLASGIYDIEIVDMDGCMLNSSADLTAIGTNEFLDYNISYTIALGESISLEGISDDASTQYLWQSDQTLSCLDCANPIATPVSTQQYILVATNSIGCTEQVVITVNVDIPTISVYIPNTFSPNGDNVNDNFQIFTNLEDSNILSTDFKVYDRWGNLIYQNAAPFGTVDWDGSFKGEYLDNGVYVYLLQLVTNSGEEIRRKGEITLAR